MLRSRLKLINHLILLPEPNIGTKQTYAIYEIHKTNPLNSTHELAEKNPILGKKGFQHPTVGRDACIIPDCEHKKCDQLCAPLKEKTYIGQQTQFMVAYPKPVINPTAKSMHIDVEKTTELNKNAEMRDNVHLNASREPTTTHSLNIGSDDPQNIN